MELLSQNLRADDSRLTSDLEFLDAIIQTEAEQGIFDVNQRLRDSMKGMIEQGTGGVACSYRVPLRDFEGTTEDLQFIENVAIEVGQRIVADLLRCNMLVDQKPFRKEHGFDDDGELTKLLAFTQTFTVRWADATGAGFASKDGLL